MYFAQALYPVLTAPDPLMGFLGLRSRSFLLGTMETTLRKDLTAACSPVHGDVNPGWRELCTAQKLAMFLLAAAEATSDAQS